MEIQFYRNLDVLHKLKSLYFQTNEALTKPHLYRNGRQTRVATFRNIVPLNSHCITNLLM